MTQPLRLRIGRSNVHLIDCGDGLVMIDAGSPHRGAWELFAQRLADHGYHPSDVKALLLTHSHADHVALARRLQEMGARVFIHSTEVDNLAGRVNRELQYRLAARLMLEHGVPAELLGMPGGRPPAPSPQGSKAEEHPTSAETPGEERRRQRWTTAPLWPDGTLVDGSALTFGSLKIRALHTPGHSPGSTVFLDEVGGTLFSGDHLLHRLVPHVGISFAGDRFEERSRNLVDYLDSLDRLVGLRARRVLPGHGEAIADLEAAVKHLKALHQKRLEALLAALGDGEKMAYELLPLLFPRLRVPHLWLGMSQVIGYLEVLEERGLVMGKEREGRRVFQCR